MGLYCSDVAGAFDRVNADRFMEKLEAKGVHEQLRIVFKSWLSTRQAYVCVDGVLSKPLKLNHMVYQGTVWGPSLWNTFYSDASVAVEQNDYLGTVFADDLNCFRVFDGAIGNKNIDSRVSQIPSVTAHMGACEPSLFRAQQREFPYIGRSPPSRQQF